LPFLVRSRVILRPSIPSDFTALNLPLPVCRVRARTAVLGDRILGIGGVAFPNDGLPMAFVEQAADAKRYPVAFHKAGLAAMAMIRELGLPRVAATTNVTNDAGRRWLERLGFVRADAKYQTITHKVIYLWDRDDVER
jgi:hypothetical protein